MVKQKRPRGVRGCATCWNPDDHPWKTGDPDSNWLCRSCRSREPNWYWRCASRRELADDPVTLEFHPTESRMEWPYQAGPFETESCIQIMRGYCLGESTRAIAARLEIQRSFVLKTIRYWRDNRGFFVETLRQSLKRRH